MATIFRDPVVTRIPQRDASAAVQSQDGVQGINILLHTNPVPFHQTDWPVPAGPRRAVTLYDVAGINILIHTNPVPFHQTEWPVPPGPRQPFMRFDAAGINLLLYKNPFPFSQKDWPVPPGSLPGVVTNRTWTQGPAVPAPAGPAPFFQIDWPNPRGPIFPLENRTFLNPLELLLLPLPPIRQFDWPVPRGPVSFDLRSFVQSFSLPQLATVPPAGSPGRSTDLARAQARSMAALLFASPNLLTTTLTPPAASSGYDFWHYYSP